MSLIDFVLTRRSIRRYEKKEIPEAVLTQILEAGRQAPSAVNKQPIHFVVVKDPEIKKGLSSFLFNRFIHDAPGCFGWMCRCKFAYDWKMGYC